MKWQIAAMNSWRLWGVETKYEVEYKRCKARLLITL